MRTPRHFRFIRTLARSLVRIYYPKIETSQRERIPRSGPVLLVANHANSLIDPVILGIAAARPVHFLAKAPLFEIPFFGTALRALGMVPAYRGSDDPGQVKSNLKSLTAAAEFIQRDEMVGIFPEGKSHDAARVDRVKSGAARIAIAAFRNGADGLKMIPVGINYELKERFRSSIWARVGAPLSIRDWLETQGEDEKQILRALTSEIDRRLKEVVVHLDEENWEPFLRDLEVLVPPKDRKQPVAAIRQRKRLADGMNYFARTDRRRAARVAIGLRDFRQKLGAAGIRITSPLLWTRGWRRPFAMAGEIIWMILVFVPALIGAVHNVIPFLLVRGITSWFRPPGKMTVSLARLGIGIPVFAAWYYFIWRSMRGYFLPWVAWIWALAMPFAGVLAQNYFSRARQHFRTWKDHFILLTRSDKIAELRAVKNLLSAQLRELDEAYNRVQPPDPVVPAKKISRPAAMKLAVRWTLILAAAVSLFVWNANRRENHRMAELQFEGPDWKTISAQNLSAQLDADEKALHGILIGVGELEKRAAELRREFGEGKRTYYRQADNDAIRSLMLSYLNYRAALLRLVWKYQSYETVTDEKLRLRSFLAGLTAGSVLYEASSEFVLQHQDPMAIRKLDEAEPLRGIPPNLFDTIHNNLIAPENRQLLAKTLQKYSSLQTAFQQNALGDSGDYKMFHAAIRGAAESAKRFQSRLAREAVKATSANVTTEGKEPVYRIKTLVSTWIGDTKIREPREGKALIRPEQVTELRRKLQPGDIMLERRNWFLSNAFLPGYWRTLCFISARRRICSEWD
ncbi:MAG: 1-acyl-sn-glycerol-3-phosphate acyltransferase [Verrucomicrobiota bacterium]